MDRSPAEFGVCLALVGGFLFGIDGDGDVSNGKLPFVWIPGGTGRLILAAPFCWTTTGLSGAMMGRDAARGK